MKRLQNLGKVLSVQEQKRIIGGDDYGGGSGCSFAYIQDSGTCGVKHNGSLLVSNISQDQAQYIADYCTVNSSGVWNWCCASC